MDHRQVALQPFPNNILESSWTWLSGEKVANMDKQLTTVYGQFVQVQETCNNNIMACICFFFRTEQNKMRDKHKSVHHQKGPRSSESRVRLKCIPIVTLCKCPLNEHLIEFTSKSRQLFIQQYRNEWLKMASR